MSKLFASEMKIKLYTGLGLFVLIVIHLLILKNITYTAWPEMFSYPYLINKGFLIYKDFAHPYVPLLSLILSLYYKIVGISLISNQLFTWTFILINDFLIFFISKKILKNFFVLGPVAVYVLLQPIFEGNMLWFDLATTPFILGSFLSFLLIKSEKKKLFWFGFLLSLALLIKQQAIVLIGLILIILLLSKETRKQVWYFILGGIVPVCVIFSTLLIQGVFKDYLFWTLEFPLIWLPKFPGYTELPGIKNTILLVTLFGLSSLFLIKNFFKIDLFGKITFVSIIATVFMAFPRFSYFHLQPAIAILIVFYTLMLKKSSNVGIFFLMIGVFYGLLLWKDYHPFIGVETARFYDKQDLSLAEFVKDNTRKEDAVYFLGPHSLIFVLADRIPPKPWIENFVWHFEIPGVQSAQIEGFKKEKSLVIFKQSPATGNWYDLDVYQPKEITGYINQNFEAVGKNQSGVEIWKRKN